MTKIIKIFDESYKDEFKLRFAEYVSGPMIKYNQRLIVHILDWTDCEDENPENCWQSYWKFIAGKSCFSIECPIFTKDVKVKDVIQYMRDLCNIFGIDDISDIGDRDNDVPSLFSIGPSPSLNVLYTIGDRYKIKEYEFSINDVYNEIHHSIKKCIRKEESSLYIKFQDGGRVNVSYGSYPVCFIQVEKSFVLDIAKKCIDFYSLIGFDVTIDHIIEDIHEAGIIINWKRMYFNI